MEVFRAQQEVGAQGVQCRYVSEGRVRSCKRPSCGPLHAQANDDYRTDYKLYTACKDDVTNLCADVDAGDGREVECLVSEASERMPGCFASLATS